MCENLELVLEKFETWVKETKERISIDRLIINKSLLSSQQLRKLQLQNYQAFNYKIKFHHNFWLRTFLAIIEVNWKLIKVFRFQ